MESRTIHINDEKAQIAFVKVSLKLTELGYVVFIPFGEPKDTTDLIALKNCKCYRIQVKHSNKGNIRGRASGRTSGYHVFNKNDFDFYGLYLSELDKVVFPSVNFGEGVIATTVRTHGHHFYWWEDFQDLTELNAVQKRTCNDFNIKAVSSLTGKQKLSFRKVKNRPNPDVLKELLWKCPTTHIAKSYNVSDNCIARWVKEYRLTKPPRGYWQRKQAGKI